MTRNRKKRPLASIVQQQARQYLMHFLPSKKKSPLKSSVLSSRVSSYLCRSSFSFFPPPLFLPFNLSGGGERDKKKGSGNNKKVRSGFLFHLGPPVIPPQGNLLSLLARAALRWEIVPGLCLFGFLPPSSPLHSSPTPPPLHSPPKPKICLTVQRQRRGPTGAAVR